MNKHTAIHILGDNPSVEVSNPFYLWYVHSGQEVAVFLHTIQICTCMLFGMVHCICGIWCAPTNPRGTVNL